jgi:hypothetical protein
VRPERVLIDLGRYDVSFVTEASVISNLSTLEAAKNELFRGSKISPIRPQETASSQWHAELLDGSSDEKGDKSIGTDDLFSTDDLQMLIDMFGMSTEDASELLTRASGMLYITCIIFVY